jgi:putative DNA primase/helicase
MERLAALETINYEVVRIAEAKRLGMRPRILDQEVAKKRRALGLESNDSDPGQGRAVKMLDVLPWPEPVNGDHVASALTAALKRYVVLSDTAADAIALWVLHTWMVDKFNISPRLAITSPTKGCGKTTVLRFLNLVVRRPKRAGSISPSALFRVAEQFQPTILLDETEKYVDHGSDLHALLNEGHAKGGTVLRVLGDKWELREFSMFGAVAFARNGGLPDDLEQRSIVIEMQRRRSDEPLSELREDRSGSLRNTARMCARWADDCDLADYDPEMGELINRVADNWRPLFAIADAIGSDWPMRVREAAKALSPRESESIGPMLLLDIKAAFNSRNTDRLFSAEVCEALAAMEGRPWPDWKGKQLTPNQLARLLRSFGVTPENVRAGSKVLKGYFRHQFEALWERYLSFQGTTEPLQRYNTDEISTSDSFKTATEQPGVADEKSLKPPTNGDCSGVAVADGAYHCGDSARRCEHCGRPGNLTEVGYGEVTAWLHRDCQNVWAAEQDNLLANGDMS